MARMTELDVFQCVCGEYVIMGRKCPVCGKTNADVLAEKEKEKQPEQPQKREKKYRPPASSGEFVDSFMFRKKKI